MDWLGNGTKVIIFMNKYKYVFLVVIFGLFLMMLPEEQKNLEQEPMINENNFNELQLSLEGILSKIDGAGKVSVLLSEYSGKETIYQIDKNVSKSSESSDIKQETVLITDSGRNEMGLIRQILSPVYQGAIVVCQGADKAVVRLAIVEAVSKVTGLSSNQISVLKMK